MTDGRTREQVHAFYRDVRDRIGALPGVEHTATGLIVPWRDALGSSFSLLFAAEGARRENSQEDPRARLRFVSPGYFDTLGVPILHGRDFDVHDRDGEERVVIVSQSVANQVFPGQDPVNRRLSWSDPIIRFAGISGEPRRIIAVVPDVDDGDIIPSPAMTIYQPTEQEGMNGRLFVRTKNDPYALVPTITREVHQMAADQPVERVSTLSDIRAAVMTPERLNAIVFGGFASLALLISVVGVAGVLAFSVSGRTREFGIRLALGAPSRHILTDVLREGLVIAGIGVGSGMIVGFAAVRAIAKYTTDLQIPGAWPLIASAALMLAAALVASAMPAVRAARVDAVQALRAE
jgi:ABC-type antimicrobial peptide transport system permease subunit